MKKCFPSVASNDQSHGHCPGKNGDSVSQWVWGACGGCVAGFCKLWWHHLTCENRMWALKLMGSRPTVQGRAQLWHIGMLPQLRAFLDQRLPTLDGTGRSWGYWGLLVTLIDANDDSTIIILCDKSLQSCPTLCNPMDCSPPVSSVHRILQARILEWVTMPSSRGSSQSRDQTFSLCGFCTAGKYFFFTTEPPWKPES